MPHGARKAIYIAARSVDNSPIAWGGQNHASLYRFATAGGINRWHIDFDGSTAVELHRRHLPDCNGNIGSVENVGRNVQIRFRESCSRRKREGRQMLSWAITFLVIALIAGVLGLSGVAGAATQIAWILFVVFLILFVVGLVMGRRPPV